MFSGTGAITNTAISHLEGDISRFQRMSSIDSFNQRSHPNEMLTGLRYFERSIKGDNGTLTKVNIMYIYRVLSELLCPRSKCLRSYLVWPGLSIQECVWPSATLWHKKGYLIFVPPVYSGWQILIITCSSACLSIFPSVTLSLTASSCLNITFVILTKCTVQFKITWEMSVM